MKSALTAWFVPRRRVGRRGVRGATTLALVAGLMVVMLLALAHGHRQAWFDQRTGASSLASTQSAAVADAGLAWLQAALNAQADPFTPVPASCQLEGPNAVSQAITWRQALLTPDATTVAAPSASGVMPRRDRRVVCHADESLVGPSQWLCDCEPRDTVTPPTPVPASQRARHRLELQVDTDLANPDLLRLVSTACQATQGSCDAARPSDSSQQRSRAFLTLRQVALLQRWPTTPLVAGGAVQVCGGTRLGPFDGTTEPPWPLAWRRAAVQSGGPAQWGTVVSARGVSNVAWPAAWDATPCPSMGPAATAESLVANDAALARTFNAADEPPLPGQTSADSSAWGLLNHLTGLSLSSLQASACHATGGDAAARGLAVVQAARPSQRPCAWIMVEGDMELSGAGALGSPDQPLFLMVSGSVRLLGNTQVVGLVYQGGAANDAIAQGASLRGAWVVAGSVQQTQSASIQYDLAVLRRVAALGPWVALPGSWLDQAP